MEGQTGVLSCLGNVQAGNDWGVQPLANRWEKVAQLVSIILFPSVYKAQVKKFGFLFLKQAPISMWLVPAILSPPTSRHTHRNPCGDNTARYQHIRNALRIYFLSLLKWWYHQIEQGLLHAQLGKGRILLTDQVPTPRLRSPLISCKYYICIALKKQTHRIATGRPNNNTNENVLEIFNTRDIKGSGSTSMPVTMPWSWC